MSLIYSVFIPSEWWKLDLPLDIPRIIIFTLSYLFSLTPLSSSFSFAFWYNSQISYKKFLKSHNMNRLWVGEKNLLTWYSMVKIFESCQKTYLQVEKKMKKLILLKRKKIYDKKIFTEFSHFLGSRNSLIIKIPKRNSFRLQKSLS